MTRFLYIGLLSARYIRSTKGISRIEALRAYSPYSLWRGLKMSELLFIHESCDREVYVIGSEARRNRQAPFRLMHEPCFI